MREIDNELLIGLYVEQEMSLRRIEKEFNLPKGRAKKLLINYEVPVRTRKQQCNTPNHKARQQDVDYIANQIIAAEKSWQDPKIRAKKIAGIIEANERPEVKEKKRTAALNALRNPLYCLEIRNASRQYWSIPENHERHSLTMREVAKRPDYQEAVSMGLREYWAKPGKRAQRALVSAAIWLRPGMREQIRRSLIRNWDERLRLQSILWGFDKKLPAFSKEEEADFFKMVVKGNNKARYEFFCRNMGLAEKLSWRIWQNIAIIFPDYQEMDIDLEVIKQEAYVALGRAIKEYDPKHFGTAFSSLAYISVPQKIIKALHDYGRLVRVPIKAVGIYNGETLRSPLYVDGVKLDDETEAVEDGFSFFLPEEQMKQPHLRKQDGDDFFALDKEEVLRLIRKRVPRLPERKLHILELRMDGLTYQEIGIIERISRERVRQILKEIMARASVVIKELAATLR